MSYAPGAMTRDEAAYYIRRSPSFVDDLQARGVLIPKRGGKVRHFLKEDLDDYLNSLPDWNDE